MVLHYGRFSDETEVKQRRARLGPRLVTMDLHMSSRGYAQNEASQSSKKRFRIASYITLLSFQTSLSPKVTSDASTITVPIESPTSA